MKRHNQSIRESGDNAGQEMPIVSLPHAIIEPHTVMVEIIDAPIARATVLRIDPAVTIAKFAEENLVVFWGEGNLPIVPRPFVVIYHAVGRVDARCHACRHRHHQTEHNVQRQQHRGVVDGDGRGKIDRD
jgi:hypothetical protein